MRHYFCRIIVFAALLMSLVFGFNVMPDVLADEDRSSAGQMEQGPEAEILKTPLAGSTFDLKDLPAYEGTPVVVINNNLPDFFIWQIRPESYISFSPLDQLQRTGTGMACLGQDTIAKEARGPIGDIRPSGWHTVRYDDLIEERYLFNRSHVLGFQLSGDNATPEKHFTAPGMKRSQMATALAAAATHKCQVTEKRSCHEERKYG